MENASKALIIAGEILLALLVLSAAVYLIIAMRNVTDTYQNTMSEQEVTKFNMYFTKYDAREDGDQKGDILIQEIVSAMQYAQEFNNEKNPNNPIKVYIENMGEVDYTRNFDSRDMTKAAKENEMRDFNAALIELIQKNMYLEDPDPITGRPVQKRYRCDINYNRRTEEGILQEIRFVQNS